MSSKVRGSKVYGAMVIAMDEGIRVGKAFDVYIDKESRQLRGISYKPGGWGNDHEIYVDHADILTFGHEVVIISGQAVGNERSEELEKCGLRKLKSCPISTQSGRQLASLADIVLSRESGKILELLLPEKLRLEIDIEQVIFGPDLIMVPAEYEPAFAQADIDEEDEQRRTFDAGEWAGKVQDRFEGVKASVRQNIPTDKVAHTLKVGSQKAKGTFLKTSQAIQQAFDQIKKTRESKKEAKEEEKRETIVDDD